MRHARLIVTLVGVMLGCSSEPSGAPSAPGASAGAGQGGGTLGGSGGSAGSVAAGAGSSGGGAGSGSSAGSGGSAGTGGGGGSGGGSPYAEDAAFCAEQLTLAAAQFGGFAAAYTDPTQVPRSVLNDVVTYVDVDDWTAGFPAGTFWLLYEHSQDAMLRSAAETWTAALYAQRLRTDTHDLGFKLMTSYGNGLRLTDNEGYDAVLLTAAQSLATRFDGDVGCTRSWDHGTWTFPVIVDNMMNLELFYRATELGGSADFVTMAESHADTTLANHFQDSGQSYHVVDYDPETGAVIAKKTWQGLADESAWARGQAWGLYGFTMSHRESGQPQFLEHALKVAEFYTKHPLMPADKVPYFDFDAPGRDDVPDYRDASAAAVAAAGLLELAGYAAPEAAQAYRAFAIESLRSLSSAEYRAGAGTNGHFLLQHSVGHYPQGIEVDAAINYADYYYVEALLRCAKLDD
jgi:unsaturated chondroitin disaccharide hydrolase